MQCGVCGDYFIFGGHGRAGHIYCRGVPAYTCWSATSIDAVASASRLTQRIFDEIALLPDFDEHFRALVRTESARLDGDRIHQLSTVDARLQRIGHEERNLTAAIREHGGLRALIDDLDGLQLERDQLVLRREELERQSQVIQSLPTMDEIRRLASASIADLLPTSPEFSRMIRRIVTQLIAVPVQLLDGGGSNLRALVEIDLSGLIGTPMLADLGPEHLRRRFIVDLFDPPQREQWRSRVAELKHGFLTFNQIGQELGITGTAAQRAYALQSLMDTNEVTDPYRLVLNPDETSFRRHRHNRYRFQSARGFQPVTSIADWLAGRQ